MNDDSSEILEEISEKISEENSQVNLEALSNTEDTSDQNESYNDQNNENEENLLDTGNSSLIYVFILLSIKLYSFTFEKWH